MSEQSPPPPPKPIVLDYKPSRPYGPIVPRPKWVYFVVGIYLLLLLVLLVSPIWESWLNGTTGDMTLLGVCVSILLICGMTLMIVPVRAIAGRPTTRRSIWIPIVSSGFLMAVLFTFAGFALTLYASSSDDAPWPGEAVMVGAACVWILWLGVFIPLTFVFDSTSLGMKLHQVLIAGSLLELLIAVPCHIVVRRRPDCCASYVTGTAICVGCAVMLISFGPSVFLLFYWRYRKISNRK